MTRNLIRTEYVRIHSGAKELPSTTVEIALGIAREFVENGRIPDEDMRYLKKIGITRIEGRRVNDTYKTSFTVNCPL